MILFINFLDEITLYYRQIINISWSFVKEMNGILSFLYEIFVFEEESFLFCVDKVSY